MKGRVEVLLGFAQKAGKIVTGEVGCKKSIKQGKAYLLIISMDASDNTKKEMRFLSSAYGIPYVEWGTKQMLGLSTGRSPRAAAAVLDQQFASAIGKLLSGSI
ncbi:MAG: L7Ae/L30e/S12e/Gadd45 family ribosomal protein [Bacillota bacterium]|jgi:ribosomal protein L7Ae-like RNA K-turn-binding protein|nr:50S ribosomal protein L7ae [Clostridia bacterium]